uniref:MAP6 domain containing 1 n=1 Tax=Chelydra serpentina TaxID=8475 RepID=A0A8C3SKV0_CHESE
MAWPCISRVCCLARFWSQLDKSDLSVPLTIHSYSDIEEPEEGASPARGGPRQPFAAETQYRRDFRAWPLQQRDASPWAGEGRRDGAPAPARSVYVLPAGDRDQRPEATANTTSYRTAGRETQGGGSFQTWPVIWGPRLETPKRCCSEKADDHYKEAQIGHPESLVALGNLALQNLRCFFSNLPSPSSSRSVLELRVLGVQQHPLA